MWALFGLGGCSFCDTTSFLNSKSFQLVFDTTAIKGGGEIAFVVFLLHNFTHCLKFL